MTTTPPTGGSTPPAPTAPATPAPAPAPATPAPAPATPAPAPAPATPAPATTPPPPPAPEPEEDDEVYGWPTWAVVLTSVIATLVGIGLLLYVLGVFSIQVRLGEIQPSELVVVTATAETTATAAMPEVTAEVAATAIPEATAAMPEPTATAAMPEPTSVPTSKPKPPTAVPPTAVPPAPTAIPPTAVPTVIAFSYNSYESGSTTVPVDSVCWGDKVTLNGTEYGDGTGPGNPVYAFVPAGTTVGLIWGSCTNEPWEAVSARLASDPGTKGKTFTKVP